MGKGTYANSLGLSGSLLDTALISHSPEVGTSGSGRGGGMFQYFLQTAYLQEKGLKEKVITLYTVSYAMRTRGRWHKKIEMFSTIKAKIFY